jgi:hypothetical protein
MTNLVCREILNIFVPCVQNVEKNWSRAVVPDLLIHGSVKQQRVLQRYFPSHSVQTKEQSTHVRHYNVALQHPVAQFKVNFMILTQVCSETANKKRKYVIIICSSLNRFISNLKIIIFNGNYTEAYVIIRYTEQPKLKTMQEDKRNNFQKCPASTVKTVQWLSSETFPFQITGSLSYKPIKICIPAKITSDPPSTSL